MLKVTTDEKQKLLVSKNIPPINKTDNDHYMDTFPQCVTMFMHFKT